MGEAQGRRGRIPRQRVVVIDVAGIQFLPSVSGVVMEMEPVSRFWAGTPATDRSTGSSPAIPRLQFRRSEDRGEKHNRLVASGQLKHARGQRPTVEELYAIKTAECIEQKDDIFKIMAERRADPERQHPVTFLQGTADGIRAAIADLVFQIKLTEAAQIERRWQLEDRLAALEAARQRE